MNKKVDFDNFAKNYVSITQKNLSFFNNSRDYFDSYKVSIAKEIIKNPKKILDFGCGIGLCIPHFIKKYPNSKIYGTDTSVESLKQLKNKHSNINILNIDDINKYKFDLIFVAGVFHHIEEDERNQVFENLVNILNNNGVLIIFEHNPKNFITRNLVRKCPYDEGVKLIQLNEMKEFFIENKISIIDYGYTLFFPSFLNFFRKFEKYMKNIWYGGQYFIAGIKK